MKAIIFIGIPATGKSTWFHRKFADTHVRINGDMLGNRGLEHDIIDACLRHGQQFVVDKMNFTKGHRRPYLEKAKRAGFLRVGYYFQSVKADAIRRNQNENRREKDLPDVAIHNAASKLELPTFEEGFDQLFYVSLDEKTYTFKVRPWVD